MLSSLTVRTIEWSWPSVEYARCLVACEDSTFINAGVDLVQKSFRTFVYVNTANLLREFDVGVGPTASAAQLAGMAVASTGLVHVRSP